MLAIDAFSSALEEYFEGSSHVWGRMSDLFGHYRWMVVSLYLEAPERVARLEFGFEEDSDDQLSESRSLLPTGRLSSGDGNV